MESSVGSSVLHAVVACVLEAGAAVMAVYNSDDFAIERKDDDSPLTQADRASHEVLVSTLADLSEFPILSEESDPAPWSERQAWDRYWLLDPLDGTKEFIKRNGEFTVNVALVEKGEPILGVVYAPAKGLLYFAHRGDGAYKAVLHEAGPEKNSVESVEPVESVENVLAAAQPIKVASPPTDSAKPWCVMGSRSHSQEDFEAFIARLPASELKPLGSSLKLCLVAEGQADLYPRLGPTSEWDTAAAQAIVEVAGGLVLNVETGQPLRYNQKESILNPKFVVCAERSPCWTI